MTRKLAFSRYSDMFIVMPGGIGTLMQLFVIYLRNQVL
ncbi:LOG family protein [Vibrio gazogenes]